MLTCMYAPNFPSENREQHLLLDESAWKGKVISNLWDAVSFPAKFTVIGQLRNANAR